VGTAGSPPSKKTQGAFYNIGRLPQVARQVKKDTRGILQHWPATTGSPPSNYRTIARGNIVKEETSKGLYMCVKQRSRFNRLKGVDFSTPG
jgi:hypothetical protein